MNATMLSGGIRAGAISPRRRSVALARPPAAPAIPAASSLRVEERGGVWCVLDQADAILAPCATERLAIDHAAALSRLPSLSRQ